MILVFYNKDMNVCVLEYAMLDEGQTLSKKEVFYNEDADAKLFKDRLRVTDHFIDKVLLNIQQRFKGQRVIIFDNSNSGSLYDRVCLMDMLFIYRREITILKAEVTEEDVGVLAIWLYEHFPI